MGHILGSSLGFDVGSRDVLWAPTHLKGAELLMASKQVYKDSESGH